MGALLDYHVTYCIDRGYKLYRDNQTAFNSVFPGIHATVLAEWWAAYKAAEPSVKGVLDRGITQYPYVLITMESDDIAHQPMGDEVYRDTNRRRVDQHIADQQVKIALFAQTPTLLRIWYEILIHTLQWSTKHMLRAGYTDFRILSADDFNADEEAVGEQYGLAGVTMRSISCVGITHRDITHWDEAYAADLPWFTLADDQVTEDGHDGGVGIAP